VSAKIFFYKTLTPTRIIEKRDPKPLVVQCTYYIGSKKIEMSIVKRDMLAHLDERVHQVKNGSIICFYVNTNFNVPKQKTERVAIIYKCKLNTFEFHKRCAFTAYHIIH